MTPRPFYRSRLFWLGLPGLVFLLWAWWFSMGYFSHVDFSGKYEWGISQSAGNVVAIWNSGGMPNWDGVFFDHGQWSVESARAWQMTLNESRETHPAFRYVIVPYYAVVLAYVAVWLLTLAWWQRRKSRLMKLHTAQ